MALTERTLRLFVSSPGDVPGERRRIDLVVERLNAEFAGRVRIETMRWERSYYSAHDTFQGQIPEAAECDVVVAVFRGRLGTPLPPAFPTLPGGEPYPSGTAYEILSAIEVRRAGKRVPDVYVFRYPNAPSVELDAPDRAEVETQWERLKAFFDRWFRNRSGEFVAAFQTYVSTDDFAVKVEDCLRQWLAQRGFLAEGPVWDRVLHGSPFPGLAAFGADRGRVFFGRDAAVGQAVGRLREAEAPGRLPFLLLVGASGSGKSSLLRAGLLPRLVLPGTVPDVDLWRMGVMTPGADPFAALADALFADAALGADLRAGTFRTRELLARQLAGDPDVALAPLRDALDRAAARRQAEAGFDVPRPARLALGIDQAERLFTEAPPAAADRFALLLAGLVRTGLATAVLALRSDAYATFQGVAALVQLREAGVTLDLLPPSSAELEAIVARPVAACVPKLAFEPDLAGRLAADARGGDALPLLQVSLARLYAAEAARGDGLLRHADYSGMDEAVTGTANEALRTLDGPARAELPALVAGLVSDVAVDARTGAPVPVVSALDRGAFEAGSPARAALVDAFVAHRLLTAEGDGARPLVRPVHEALLRIWPEAVAILAESASLIRVRHSLAPLVRAWSEADEKAGHLDLSPALLDGAQALLARFGADLPDGMGAFITAAAAADAARRDRERAEAERRLRDAQALAAANRRTARRTMVGLAATLVLAALAGWQWREAGQQRDRAQRSLALATDTANGLVSDLAQKFDHSVGVPARTVKDILDRARALQDQLLASGEATPELRISQADALLHTALTLETLGDTGGALATAQRANGILHDMLDGPIDVHHDYAVSYVYIGEAQQAQGDPAAALASYQTALALRQGIARLHPGDRRAKRDIAASEDVIGDAYRFGGDSAAALPHYAASLEIAKELAAGSDIADRHRELSVAQHKMGLVQQSLGDLKGAVASQAASLAIATRLSEADPGDTKLLLDQAIGQTSLGDAQSDGGDRVAAVANYALATATLERLVRSDPSNTSWQRDLALDYGKTGDVQQANGDLAAAEASFKASLAIRQRLAQSDRDNDRWQNDLRIGYFQLARVHQAMGRLTEALADHQSALAIAQRRADRDPGLASNWNDVALALGAIGTIQQRQGDTAAALASLQGMLEAGTGAVARAPGNPGFRRGLAIAHVFVGSAQEAAAEPDAALASYRAALAAADGPDAAAVLRPPEQADMHARIGRLLFAADDRQGAAEGFRAALAIDQARAAAEPSNLLLQHETAGIMERLGQVQEAQGDLTAAFASYAAALAGRQKLADLLPNSAAQQNELAATLAAAGELAGRLGEQREARTFLLRGRDVTARLLEKQPGDPALSGTLAGFDQRLAGLDTPR